MDPVNLLTEVYHVAGYLGVMLAILCLVIYGVWKFLIKRIDRQDAATASLQKEMVSILKGTISENSEVLQEVVQETRNQTAAFRTVVEVLGGRPCLIETDRYHKRPSLPDINPNPALQQRTH